MATSNVTTITVRELKTYASEFLRKLEEAPDSEFIITKHGKPCAKLVPIDRKSTKVPISERISLRNTWSHLPELSEADFAEAKRIWEPRVNE
jgi:prevent-host-death family protein